MDKSSSPPPQPFRTTPLPMPTVDELSPNSKTSKKQIIQRRGRRKSADLGNYQFHWKLEKANTREKKDKKNNHTISESSGANLPTTQVFKLNSRDKRGSSSLPNLGPSLETFKAAQQLSNFKSLSTLSEKERTSVITKAAKLTSNEQILNKLKRGDTSTDEELSPKRRKICDFTDKEIAGNSDEDKLNIMHLTENSPIMNPIRCNEEYQPCKSMDACTTQSLAKMSIANLVQ